jgi:hypothetical protein
MELFLLTGPSSIPRLTSVDMRGRCENLEEPECHFAPHNRTCTRADTNRSSRCYSSDCCLNFAWPGIWTIDMDLKTNFWAGKHFGETRTKSESYIQRGECCTVLPNLSVVVCGSFSPEASGSQSVLRWSLGIRGCICVMVPLRFTCSLFKRIFV